MFAVVRAWHVAFIVMLLVPSASAATGLENAWINVFESVSASDMTFDDTACEFSEFTILGGARGFSFEEAPPVKSELDGTYPPGYFNAGCGYARYDYVAPVAAFDHIHVRFMANRTIDHFIAVAPIQVAQTVHLPGMDAPHDVFSPGDGSRQSEYIWDPQTSDNASAGTVEFAFEDTTFFDAAGEGGDAASGVAVTAHVWDIELEYSYVPATVESVETHRRAGDSVAVQETAVAVHVERDILRNYDVNIQVQMDPGLAIDHVVAPDGTILRETGTRTRPGPEGYDRLRILVEDISDADVHQVTVPHDLVAVHGPGTYQLVFHERNVLAPSAILMPLAIGALVLPAGGAAFAGYGLRRFRKTEAPAYEFAGRSMLRVLLLLLAGYGFALLVIFIGPGAKGLATPPPTAAAMTAYVLLAFFAAAFVYLWYLSTHTLLKAAQSSREVARRSAAELSRSNEDLEQFAHIAGHDLKEPLRTIRNYTTLLKRRYEGKLDAQATEFIDYAHDGAERMGQLIDGLLEYSRVDSAGGERSKVSMDAVTKQVKRDLQRQLEEAGGKITQGRLPNVAGSRAQLHQVMLNLISNSIKFRDESRKLHVSVRAVREGRMWRFEVQDNGMGIAAASADRIFEMFYHVDPTKDRGGTGVGLAVVRRVIERHGGSCGVASDPGNGCRVWFTLPHVAEGMQ